ncbi:MAG: response regulator [Nitrospira sp.]|nr:response regulator [Nitrospira sp.]
MRIRLGLRGIVNLITISLVAITVGIAWSVIQRETTVRHQNLVDEGLTIAAMVAENSEYAVYTENQEALRRAVAGLNSMSDIAYVAISNRTNQTLLEQSFSALGAAPVPQLRSVSASTQTRRTEMIAAGGVDFVSIVAPILSRTTSSTDPLFLESSDNGSSSAVIGYIHIVLSLQPLQEYLHQFMIETGMLVIAVLLVGLLLAFVLMRTITQPLLALTEATGHVAEGRFDIDISPGGAYEVDQLASSFRQMTAQLKTSQQQVINYQQSLEIKVAERTEQLEAATQEAHRLAEEAQAASRAKSQFLANMSHEIRTPMNGVIGMTELLLNSTLTEKQRHLADSVHRSGTALLGIINDILDFSKIEAGKLELERLEFGLRDTVEEAVELFAEPAGSKGLELTCFLPEDLPDSVIGDPVRLRQVLLNLLGNAVKFTERGEVTVSVRLLQQDAHALMLKFEVADTGVGIAPETQARLFTAFTQADGSTTRHFGGTGLGLAIVKQLVQLMGGAVGITSTAGQGSTFWFTLQLGCAVPREQSSPMPDRFLSGLRMLIVDDNETNRFILQSHLTTWGAEAISTATGAEALDLLTQAAKTRNPFALAILDIHMPKMDGIMLAQAIKADPAIHGVTLLALSSVDSHAHRGRTEQLGFFAWLQKPARQSTLRDCLRRYRQGTAAKPISVAPKPLAPAVVGGHLLLVEDNPINREVATGLLELLGYHVDSAEQGHQACDLSATRTYDVILMDCQMPVMDGFSATATIREREQRTHATRTPIIALTANAMEGDRDRCLAAGMDDYLSKPFSHQALSEMLIRWCPPEGVSRVLSAEAPLTTTTDLAGDHSSPTSPIPPPEPVDRTAWAPITALKRPGQPNMLHKVISLYLTSSQAQVTQLRQALQGQEYDTIRLLAHTLKSSSATLGAHRLAALATQLEETCGTEHSDQSGDLIALIETAHRDACIIFSQELGSSRKEAA